MRIKVTYLTITYVDEYVFEYVKLQNVAQLIFKLNGFELQ